MSLKDNSRDQTIAAVSLCREIMGIRGLEQSRFAGMECGFSEQASQNPSHLSSKKEPIADHCLVGYALDWLRNPDQHASKG